MSTSKINICLLDFDDLTLDALKNENYHTYNGSLGTKVKIRYGGYRNDVFCKSNENIPSNIHEFNVIAVDLNDDTIIPYIPDDHSDQELSRNSELKFRLSYPTNVFDPKPIGAFSLNEKLDIASKTKTLMIVFAGPIFSNDFHPVEYGNGGFSNLKKVHLNNYGFIDSNFLSQDKYGKVSTANNTLKDKNLVNLLNTYNDLEYHQTFKCPYYFEEGVAEFTPLLFDSNSEIISFASEKENFILFMFPDIKDKTGFLKDFLSEICPEYLPELYMDNLTWLNKKEYWLPGYESILDKKENLIKQHEERILKIDDEIQQNNEKYLFLHKLISETGDDLVDAVLEVLKFIGFEKVIKFDDKISNGIFEEDIQVIHNEKLLVIEVKGIAGTSKDSECSQISKIRLRRMKEKKLIDVYALYIVNNERHKPPFSRTNPPFNQIQIDDAISDDRGLLTTTQLFNLYHAIEAKILDKEEIKDMFFDYGLINFLKNLKVIGKVEKTYQDMTVASVNLDNTSVKVGDLCFSETNGRLSLHIIKSLQQNKTDLPQVENGLTGICLDSKVKAKSILYKRNDSH